MLCRFLMIWVALFSFGVVHASSPRETHFLKDSLALAEPGDYIVVLQGKTYTLLHIFSRDQDKMVVEEISAPQARLPRGTILWKKWVGDGAPRHTSWFMYEIDLTSGNIREFYSFSQRGWADIDPDDNLLSTMLSLKLLKLRDDERKQVGSSSMTGQRDRRRPWQPSIIVEGKTIEGIAFDAWRTQWPRDGSDLSGKTIDLYLPSKPTPEVPAYFPAWLEVSGTFGKAKLRLVNSGKGLHSPQAFLPRRPPLFLDNGKWEKGELVFQVRARPYFTSFHLYAFDPTQPRLPFREVTHQIEPTRNEEIKLVRVAKSSLLGRGLFWFQIAPDSYPELTAETSEGVVIP